MCLLEYKRLDVPRLTVAGEEVHQHDHTELGIVAVVSFYPPDRKVNGYPKGMAAKEDIYSKIIPRRLRPNRHNAVKRGSHLDVLLSMGFPHNRA